MYGFIHDATIITAGGRRAICGYVAEWLGLGLQIRLMQVRSLLPTPEYMRGSYSGNTLAFQAKARGSIPLPRSKFVQKL